MSHLAGQEWSKTYAEIVYGWDEPTIAMCSRAAAIFMVLECGEDVPEVLLPPNGPGFSVQ